MDKYLPFSFNKELLRTTDFKMSCFLPCSLPNSSAKMELHLFFPGRNGNPVSEMRG